MYKRFSSFVTPLVVVLAFILVGTFTVSAAASGGYTDVKEGDDHYEGIKTLIEEGIFTGYEDGTFRQWNKLQRQHVAVLLTRAMDFEEVSDLDKVLEVYEDVNSNSEYAKEIAILTKKGVFSGNNGKFNPRDPITREQLAKVLVLALGLDKYETDKEVEINLSNVDDSHKDKVQTLANLELTDQLDDFRPTENISRGAVASLLHRALQLEQEIDAAFTLSVMHMNDTHARVTEMPRMITAINKVRNEKPNALLLHAGDAFSGTLYFNEFEGEADLALMKLMGFDAMVFGNHEFDLGSKGEGHASLAKFVKEANFPFVATNIDFSKDENLGGLVSEKSFSDDPQNGEIYSQIVKEVDGEKIGVFGITTEDTANISSPGDVEFNDYITAAEEAVEAFEEQGIDKIIALTHIGYDSNPEVGNDLLLAELDGIDVIVGGHSHTKLEKPKVVDTDADGEKKDPTVIVQAHEYVNYLGTLDVDFDENGAVVGYAGELIDVHAKDEDGNNLFAEDKKGLVKLEGYAEQVEKVMHTKSEAIAIKDLHNPRFSAGDEVSVRANETELGNLITDGMLAKAREYDPNTVIAMQNGGGIRTNIEAGPVTYGQIISVLPFGNTLSIVKLTGAEIKDVLEHSVSNAPSESGGFLHVSGMKFTYDSSKEVGNRVLSMKVKENGDGFIEIDPVKEYVVTTNAFTVRGGDGFDMLQKAYDEGRVNDLGLSDWENLRDHMESLGSVDPKIEGRIIDVAAEKNNN